MNRTTNAAAFAAIMAVSAAHAQTTQTPGGTMTPGTTTTPGTQTPSMNRDTTGSITGMYYTMPVGANMWRASDLVGKSVYNTANERIGEVNELILDREGKVAAALIGVGGFLGIGERQVAVNYSALQMNTASDGMRIVVNADRNQLQQAPAFRSPDTWRSR